MFKPRKSRSISPAVRLTPVQVIKLSGGPVLLGLGLLALSVAAAGALAWTVVGAGPSSFDIGPRSAGSERVPTWHTPATVPSVPGKRA